MDTRDIKGHLSQLESYAKNTMGYDKAKGKFEIWTDKYEITLDCDDDFQSKIGYDNRVEQELIYETFDYEKPLNEAVGEIFARLSQLMSREERELRCGLNLIGKSIEAGAGYRTHVGLEFVSSMKKEQEKTMLMLPNRSSPVPAPTVSDAEVEEMEDAF